MKFVESYQFSDQEVVDIIYAIDLTIEDKDDTDENQIMRLENIKNTFIAYSKDTESDFEVKKNN
ncbi:hypothetical protein [Virgibacillus litoralis]|uniref:Uncharacterized protein n=1 Tax=Virgibacillus litoralis TaxID=578221 RepID=A0ABS4HC31_9BACI|nr:hypothetical protein [Virgibacillus litoralis]MBP1948474.1 hypothetical protein [Virgibacillus litoralis]